MAERRRSKAERARIAARTNYRCSYCGADLGERWHLDHIEPLRRDGHALSGGDGDDNIRASCGPCNRLKSVFSVEEFRALISRQVAAARRDSAAYRTALRYGLITETGAAVRFYFEERRHG